MDGYEPQEYELYVTTDNGETWVYKAWESTLDMAQFTQWALESEYGIGMVQIRLNGENVE